MCLIYNNYLIQTRKERLYHNFYVYKSDGNHTGNVFVLFIHILRKCKNGIRVHRVYIKGRSMYQKRRKFPVCLFYRTTSSLLVRSLRFAVVMRVDEDSRTGRFNFLRSLHLYHSPFRSSSFAQHLIVLSLALAVSFADLNDIPNLLPRFFLSQVIFRTVMSRLSR